MLKNITERQRKTTTEYSVEFLRDDTSGFSFPCDAHGNLLPMSDCARANYEDCMAHPEKWEKWNAVTKYTFKYTEPAHGTCVCGREVTLVDEFYGACQCECGRWYNLFGQELLEPENWEEDSSEYYGGWD